MLSETSFPTRTLQLAIQGSVQGLGFRPFVYNLARRLQLRGYVLNSPTGVEIVATGSSEHLDAFLTGLQQEKPALVHYQGFVCSELPPTDWPAFEIRPSLHSGAFQAVVLPDLAVCPACRSEILDPENRRYGYAFTNCTACGPRYSIMHDLPYDRPHTSMQVFQMCQACLAEYTDPTDRRFHAQPNACPDCGPELTYLDSPAAHQGPPGSLRGAAALSAAIQTLAAGRILALKGLGGFQLLCDATRPDVVAALRQRKNRPDKPLALMMPDLETLSQYCRVSEPERELLQSAMAPILLLRCHSRGNLAAAVTQTHNPLLGVMLPTTPVHVLLLQALQRPLVATSGNRSQEPLAWQNDEALVRLGTIADGFLLHNRPILRPADDSVLRFFGEQAVVLRRARGYAPLPVVLPRVPQCDLLALGAHLKNTQAFALKGRAQAIISPHLGDLDHPLSEELFAATLAHFQKLYRLQPGAVARDLHPDYLSSQVAENLGIPVLAVQHHYAHVLACMAEHQLSGPVLGFAWDGLGLGEEGQLWGGEALEITPGGYVRRASFEPWLMAGGESALRKPAYQALSWLWQSNQSGLDLAPCKAVSLNEQKLLQQALAKGLNCYQTSSVGRLFDMFASLLDLCQFCSFEGQAAMALEFLADSAVSSERHKGSGPGPSETASLVELALYSDKELLRFPTSALLAWLLAAIRSGQEPALIALQFHQILARALVQMAQAVGIQDIVLTGGCFQNALLHRLCREGLQAAGFRVYWPQALPPNDGGLALGQLYALLREQTKETPCV